jgi:hypothetical protein
MNLGRKAKAIVAGVTAVALVAGNALTDNVLDVSEAGQLVTAIFTAAVGIWAVWRVPNQPAS